MSGDSAIGMAASGLLGTMLALAFVLLLAFGSLRLMRAWQQRSIGKNPQDGSLRFVRSLPVGPRERVVIIEVDGTRMLIGVSAASVTMLGNLAPIPPAPQIGDQP